MKIMMSIGKSTLLKVKKKAVTLLFYCVYPIAIPLVKTRSKRKAFTKQMTPIT
jgi:hypothetical protein